ncbi:preprotein translocase subunit SecG [Candidatus Uhrbacteria bacterium]|nr:preprotein translocase subunit SecG [Candidatus Uhrbacteria bacterium]
MEMAFRVIQLASSLLLIVAILLQQRGTGLGAAFGGEGNVYRTKRGIEKKLFSATIVLAALFLLSSLGVVLLAR